jgi:hypothetical protein
MPEQDFDFDEEWYLSKYPDVAIAIGAGRVKSALDHYVRHGKHEGRLPFPADSPRRVVHLHIPKTAGTAIRGAFLRAKKQVLNANPAFAFNRSKDGAADVISGHFGYRSARTVPNPHIITVLRDPVDRFLSVYYYLAEQFKTGKEISERTKLASNYSIDDFVDIFDCPDVTQELFNAVTWQIVDGTTFGERLKYRNQHRSTDSELLARAIENLKGFALVGFQSDMPRFAEKFGENFGFPISLENENVTATRSQADDLSTRTLRKIYDWVYLDTELYRWARNFYGN